MVSLDLSALPLSTMQQETGLLEGRVITSVKGAVNEEFMLSLLTKFIYLTGHNCKYLRDLVFF